MSDEYRISIELTRGEIASYNFHHIRWLLRLDAFGFAVLLLGVYFSIICADPGTRNTLSIMVLWGVLFLAVGLSQPFILFLQIFILKTPAVADQMKPKLFVFDDSGIHIQSDNRRAATPWTKITTIKDVGRLILIYTSPRLAYVIPKRYFQNPEERDRFIKSLLDKVMTTAR